MIRSIRAVFRYSMLILLILVLSHIIEIQGVSVSEHVLNGMRWVGEFSPGKIAARISADISHQYRKVAAERFDSIEDIGGVSRQIEAARESKKNESANSD